MTPESLRASLALGAGAGDGAPGGRLQNAGAQPAGHAGCAEAGRSLPRAARQKRQLPCLPERPLSVGSNSTHPPLNDKPFGGGPFGRSKASLYSIAFVGFLGLESVAFYEHLWLCTFVP